VGREIPENVSEVRPAKVHTVMTHFSVRSPAACTSGMLIT